MISDIAIVIATRNRSSDLRECLKSLLKQEYSPKQTIVVDQSDEGYINTNKKMAKEYGAEYYFLPPPNSSARSRNVGINKVASSCVLFIDDDVVLEKDYLKNLELFFREYESAVGATGLMNDVYQPYKLGLGGKVRFIAALISKLLRSIFLLDTLDIVGYELSPVFETSRWIMEPSMSRRVGVLSGANMCFRTDILKKEIFDIKLKKYSFKEDVDLSYRAGKYGGLWLLPKCRLLHKASGEGRIAKSDTERMKEVYAYYHFCKNLRPGFLGKLLFAYSRVGRLIIRIFSGPSAFIDYVRILLYVARNRKMIEKGETEDFLQS